MYAGFWKRFVAYIIDGFILNVCIYAIIFLLAIIFGISSAMDADYLMGSNLIILFFMVPCLMALPWLYYALFESSTKQATPGKMVLGIKVTDLYGNRIGFGRATGRFFGKIISGLILSIGYIMAAFTKDKQALHDMIAGTLVVNSGYQSLPRENSSI